MHPTALSDYYFFVYFNYEVLIIICLHKQPHLPCTQYQQRHLDTHRLRETNSNNNNDKITTTTTTTTRTHTHTHTSTVEDALYPSLVQRLFIHFRQPAIALYCFSCIYLRPYHTKALWCVTRPYISHFVVHHMTNEPELQPRSG